MTLLAVDYGARRIGVAVTDSREKMALPVGVFSVRSEAEGVEKIRKLVEERGPRGIVVGVPLAFDGGETEMSGRVRAFAEKLRATVAVSVTLADERHTTEKAEAPMIEAGLSTRKRRGKADAGAATIILQDYLRSHPGPKS